MATVVDALVVTLGLDTAGVDKGIAATESKFASLASVAAKALTVVGGVAVLKSVVSDFLGAADSVGKLSDALGVDMVELQAWSEAAKRSGGSAEGFQASVGALSTQLEELAATGEGGAKKVLQELGVSATDAAGKARPTLEVMRDLAGKFETMSRQKALGLGRKLGLDPGTIMLLQQGKVSLDDLIARQKEIGVYSKRHAEVTAAANDAYEDMSQSWRIAAANGLQYLIPFLAAFWSMLADLGIWFQDNETFVFAFFTGLAGIIGAILLPVLIKTGMAMLAAFWPIIAIGAAVTAVAALVAALVDDFLAWGEGGESVFGDLWVGVDKLLGQFRELWAAASPIVDTFLEFGGVVAAIAFDTLLAGLGTVIDIVTTLLGILLELGGIIVAVFSGDFDKATKAAMAIVDAFLGFIGRFVDRVKDLVSGIAGKVMSFFGFGGDEKEGGAEPSAPSPEPLMPPPGESLAPASVDNSKSASQTVQNDTRIEQITVNVPNGDPQAIADGIGSGMQNSMSRLANNADSGVAL